MSRQSVVFRSMLDHRKQAPSRVYSVLLIKINKDNRIFFFLRKLIGLHQIFLSSTTLNVSVKYSRISISQKP